MVRMVTRLRVVLACLPAALLGACSGGAQSPKCVPGLTRDCPCPTGQPGAQRCTSAGTFAACVCAAPAVDGGGPDGAGDTTSPATPTDGAEDQTSLPADASTAVADGGGQVGATDSGLPADEGGQVVMIDSGLPADEGAGDAAYVANGCGDGIVALPEQ